MIRGNVVGLQARISVAFRVADPPDVAIEFVVDTGFEGALTLPPAAIAALGLPYLTELNANLANDDNIQADVHVATIMWNGVEREVAVLAIGRRPLLGAALLDGHHLGVDFADNGPVVIDGL